MADQTTSQAIEVSSSPRPTTPAERRASSHAGTTDTDQLVSDIEKTREELAVTIDAIVDRVSPKKVMERSKQQAREGLNDASVIVKEHAGTAAVLVREKALVASEAVKTAAAQLKERVSGTSDATPVRSPLSPATSVAVGSATPIAGGTGAGTSGPGASGSGGSSSGAPAPYASAPRSSATGSSDSGSSDSGSSDSGSSAPSPLPAGTVSLAAGELPPPEPVDTTGSLADAADRSGASFEPAGSELPAARPVTQTTAAPPPVPPVYLGAGLAALAALVALLARRRRSRRAARPGRRR